MGWKENKEAAYAHWKHVEEVYSEEIKEQIANSQVCHGFVDNIDTTRYDSTRVRIVNCPIEEIVHQYRGKGKICVLNFADYKLPGGKFTEGSRAQEESICHASTLFPVLNEYAEVYADRTHINNGLYDEDYIYTPDVIFEAKDGTITKADVLTYAAPNMIRKPKTKKYYDVLTNRMSNVFSIPNNHDVDIYIIGAWGCGVFCNDVDFVANYFHSLAKVAAGAYAEIVHPIPTIKNRKNLDVFLYHHVMPVNTDDWTDTYVKGVK